MSVLFTNESFFSHWRLLNRSIGKQHIFCKAQGSCAGMSGALSTCMRGLTVILQIEITTTSVSLGVICIPSTEEPEKPPATVCMVQGAWAHKASATLAFLLCRVARDNVKQEGGSMESNGKLELLSRMSPKG